MISSSSLNVLVLASKVLFWILMSWSYLDLSTRLDLYGLFGLREDWESYPVQQYRHNIEEMYIDIRY